ncbi:T9SS type A sorting domain-containing protein [Aureispira anguillae]|uniref:T9SS type A sorting domain-containing protein n=1 Tax=Aureispira anguillae TaxID=2864201 RepID=A0A916DWB6_9BACT|nr:T9SS type A sorting domain-containing protein [Aureispira anguillae]BDS14622.1 T9SS type A sorting domain-containing protein [Aureispira anguillae]
MKQFIKIALLTALSGFVSAQGDLVNHGANIVLDNNAAIYVEGAVTNENNGTINNNGAIYLKDNWTQTGSSTTYLGTGWLRFEGNNNQTINSTAPLALANLSVNNNNRLLLTNNLSISTTVDLNNNGNIELGNYQLALANSATITGYDANHYIITNGTGTLSQEVGVSTVHYPIGNTSYNLASINNTGLTDIFSIRVADQLLKNGTNGLAFTEGVVNNTWFIEENTTGGSLVNMTLQWNSSQELPNFIRSNAGIAHYTNGAWDQSSGFGTASLVSGTQYQLSASGISSFSPFGIATQQIDLPVELIAFNAKRSNAILVQLDWATATEINNEGFYIERMLAPENEFETIAYVEGQGNTVQQTLYQLTDENPYTGMSYYRLRQVDFDGTISYSEIRAVAGKALEADLSVFPNPTSKEVTILLRNVDRQAAVVSMLDASGKKVLEYTTILSAQKNIKLLNLDRFPSGIYLLHIALDDDRYFNQKLIIESL